MVSCHSCGLAKRIYRSNRYHTSVGDEKIDARIDDLNCNKKQSITSFQFIVLAKLYNNKDIGMLSMKNEGL